MVDVSSWILNGLGMALWVVIFLGLFRWIFRKHVDAYLEAKGKNLATKEDFKDILDQSKKTAEATEKIKNEITSKFWIQQQHWNNKDKHYFAVVSELAKINVHLERLVNNWRELLKATNSRSPEKNSLQTEFARIVKILDEGMIDLEVSIAPALIFLSDDSSSALQNLLDKKSIFDVESIKREEFESFKREVVEALQKVRKEARQELMGMEEMKSPQ